MKSLLVIAVLSALSCQLKDKTRAADDYKKKDSKEEFVLNPKTDSATFSYSKIPQSFLDSVSGKLDLTINQVKKYTLIDSGYYTGISSDAAFAGDTVFDFRTGHKGVIIQYDDRKSCIYKFLLAFDPGRNQSVDCKLIYTDCDHDESADYTFLRYNLLNNSIFETIETYIPAMSRGDVRRIKSQKQKWKVNKDGKIDSAQ